MRGLRTFLEPHFPSEIIRRIPLEGGRTFTKQSLSCCHEIHYPSSLPPVITPFMKIPYFFCHISLINAYLAFPSLIRDCSWKKSPLKALFFFFFTSSITDRNLDRKSFVKWRVGTWRRWLQLMHSWGCWHLVRCRMMINWWNMMLCCWIDFWIFFRTCMERIYAERYSSSPSFSFKGYVCFDSVLGPLLLHNNILLQSIYNLKLY